MIIEYHPSVYAPIRTIIEPRFDRVKHLFPSWCNKVYVYYDPTPDGNTMIACSPKYEYRSINIVVHHLFIEDEDNWHLALLHEIQHGMVRPFVAKTERVLTNFIQDQQILEYVLAELVEAEEACVQDLAIFACKLVDSVVD